MHGVASVRDNCQFSTRQDCYKIPREVGVLGVEPARDTEHRHVDGREDAVEGRLFPGAETAKAVGQAGGVVLQALVSQFGPHRLRKGRLT